MHCYFFLHLGAIGYVSAVVLSNSGYEANSLGSDQNEKKNTYNLDTINQANKHQCLFSKLADRMSAVIIIGVLIFVGC